jgi:hypothetical protein
MIYEDGRTLEEIYRNALSGLYARLRSHYDFIYARLGEDGLKLIADMSYDYGKKVAEKAKPKLPGDDLASVAGYLLRVFDTVSHGSGSSSVVEHSKERFVIRINRCPLEFTDSKMCLAHTMMEKGLIEGLNPGLSYRIGKSIPAGDSWCEHIVEFCQGELFKSWSPLA